ncbi:MAG: prepilin peptidase [Azospirillaceae bacterium]
MIATLISLAALAAVAGLALWAAVSDARTMTIPNTASVGIVAAYPVWLLGLWLGGAWLGGPAGTAMLPALGPVWAVAIAALVLAIGFAMFAAGFAGGGDVKLLTALALWAGPWMIFEFLVVTSAAGGLLAVALGTARMIRRRTAAVDGLEIEAGKPPRRRPIPYGIAIAAGGLVVLARLAAV